MAAKVGVNQPSTSSATENAALASDKAYIPYIYDILIDLNIDIPNSHYEPKKSLSAVSATLVAHIFVSEPDWNFLTTPILRSLDTALTSRDDWRPHSDRLLFKSTVHLKGYIVNVTDKPTDVGPTYNQLSYNGCVDASKVVLDYKIKLQFMPGIVSALKIYDSHGWNRNNTAQTDDIRSVTIRKILERHEENTKFNLEFTWKEAVKLAEQIVEVQQKFGTKRKHKD